MSEDAQDSQARSAPSSGIALSDDEAADVEALERQVIAELYAQRDDGSRVARYTSIKPWHHQVIALHVAGVSSTDIAIILRRSIGWVSSVTNHPALQSLKHQLTAQLVAKVSIDARSLVQASTKEAAEKVLDLMRNAGKQDIQLRAAFGIMDRGGLPKVELIGQATIKLDRNELASIREALSEMREEVPEMIEVDSTHEAISAASKS